MAHRLNIDSIHQSVLLLLNLCYAAETYARTHDLSTYDEADTVGGPYYVGWLKATLSEKLIDIAIKTRILLDIIRVEAEAWAADGEKYPVDVVALDAQIVAQHNIGFFTKPNAELSLREACNKIIHAVHVRPVLEEGVGEHDLDEESEVKRAWQYWAGALELSGTKGKDEWEVTLHIPDFSKAIDEFIYRIDADLDWESVHYDVDVF